MIVVIRKGRDGPPSLTCIRADGSKTWSRLHPFFPMHDLTHFAVESVLRLREAFFGLIASGWTVEAFAEKGSSARLPPEAIFAEHLVGLFDLERAGAAVWTATQFREALQAALGPAVRAPTAEDLTLVRRLRDDLHRSWLDTAPGDTLELRYPADVNR